MRQLSEQFREFNTKYAREPRFYAKINNEIQTLYLTSNSDIVINDPGSAVFNGVVVDATSVYQKIQPERGISSFGGSQIIIQDRGFTTKLNEIFNANDTINNNKVELFIGFKGMDLANYLSLTPMFVSNISNTETTYTILLKDAQRFEKKNLFSDRPKTSLVNSPVYGAGIFEVISSDGFELVEHDDNWTNAPGQDAGYFVISGINSRGQDVKEVCRYDSKPSSTQFNVVERGVFGTSIVEARGSEDPNIGVDGAPDIDEFVYLDLPLPKMLVALLTNDLLNQPGKTIPAHWGLQLAADLVDINSIVTAGDDLDNINLEFLDLEQEDGKDFIAQQCLAPFNLFFRINDAGELALVRFTPVPEVGASDLVLNASQITQLSGIRRDNKNVRNQFLIEWESVPFEDRSARFNYYQDDDSIDRNNDERAYTISLRGIRNRDRNSNVAIQNLANGITARFSDPSITRSMSAFMRDAIELEVGDIVGIDVENFPEFTTDSPSFAAYEIQGARFDFLRQICSFDLYTSIGSASDLILDSGEDPTNINHPSPEWTDITTVLAGSIVPGSPDRFEVTGGTLPEGKYFYDGDIRFLAGSVTFIEKTVIIDAFDIDMVGDAKIDGRASESKPNAGVRGAQGFFGGNDYAQEGLNVDTVFFNRYFKRRTREAADGNVPAKNPAGIPSLNLRISQSGDLTGLPTTLYGNGGSRGTKARIIAGGDDADGGQASIGGAGLMLICDNFFFDFDSVVDTSGQDNFIGSFETLSGNEDYAAGSGGMGWPGAFYCVIKSKTNPLPNLDQVHIGETGRWRAVLVDVDNYSGALRPPSNGDRDYDNEDDANHVPLLPASVSTLKNIREANQGGSRRTFRLVQDTDAPTTPGIDPSPNPELPDLAVIEQVNEPFTPEGNISTLTFTATPQPGDDAYNYAFFEYRILGQDQWVSVDYLTRNETSVQVQSNGATYEVSARPVNNQGVISEARQVVEYTVATVKRETEESDGGQPDASDRITLPPIRGFELVNRISEDDFDKFKSPNAEFRWIKMSNTAGGNLTQVNGVVDLHLEGYEVQVLDEDGNVLREVVTKDSFYTYTFDENKKDNLAFNRDPVRKFTVQVQAVSTTGFASGFTGFEVENPEPAAPTGITTLAGFKSIQFNFTLPSDVDFVGVDFYLLEGTTGDVYADGEVTRVANNVFNPDGLKIGTTYQIGAVSVDQFGTGGQIDQFGVITSSVVDGQLNLDEATEGRLVTNNEGYVAIMGVTNLPDVTSPIVFAAYDSIAEDTIFYVDVNGEMRLNFLNALAAIAVGSAVFGGAGCQIENNNGDPRLSIGAGTPDTNITFEDSKLDIGREINIVGVDAYSNTSLYKSYVGGEYGALMEAPTNVFVTDEDLFTSFAFDVSLGTLPISAKLEQPVSDYSFSRFSFDDEVRLKFLASWELAGANQSELTVGVGGNEESGGQGVHYYFRRDTATTWSYGIYLNDPLSSPVRIVLTSGRTEFNSGGIAEFEFVFTPQDSIDILVNGSVVGTVPYLGNEDLFPSGIANVAVFRVTNFDAGVFPDVGQQINIGDVRIMSRSIN